MADPVTLTTITFSERPLGAKNAKYTFANVLPDGKDLAVQFVGEVVSDGNNPDTPAFSSNSSYTGPVTIIFSSPVSNVAFGAGVFNKAGSTRVIVYGRNDFQVETKLNTFSDANGDFVYEPFAFGYGENAITKIKLLPVGDEPAGFAIDNFTVTFRPESRKVALSGEAAVDGLIHGIKWNGNTVTYSFLKLGSEQPGYGDGPQTFGTSKLRVETTGFFNAAQRDLARQALDLWDDVAGLKFVGKDDLGAAPGMIRFGTADIPSRADAFFPGDNPEAGDVKVKTGLFSVGAPPGTENYLVLLHELGHSLGLKHPHEAGKLGTIVPAGKDSLEFSVMSYRSYVNAPFDGGYSNRANSFPQTLMMNDIAAIQYLYGANFNHAAGDSHYRFNPAKAKIFQTIWDGGGKDTYDASDYTDPVRLDLRPGQWSVLADDQLAVLRDNAAPIKARGSVFNALLFNNDQRSLIENAIGGSGSDNIVGNNADNRLDGRLGDDEILGLAGNDNLISGSGSDTLRGGFGDDRLQGGSGTDELDGGPGKDSYVFTSVADSSPGIALRDEILSFAKGADKIVLKAIDAISATLVDDAFAFIGNADFTGPGQLRAVISGGETIVSANVDSNLLRDFQFSIKAAILLEQGDFVA